MFDVLNLELLADDPEVIESSRKAIRDRTLGFRRDYLDSHSKLRFDRDVAPLFSQLEVPLVMGNPFEEHDQSDHYLRLLNLFRNLETGRFWGTIDSIDGSSPRQSFDLYSKSPADESRDAYQRAQEARKWSEETFSDEEMQELFTLVVNQALLQPYKTSWPGTNKGHSILLRELVEKPYSIFEHSIDEKFTQRLANGTFWEELSDMSVGLNHGESYRRVNKVLTDFAYLLDPELAPKGVELFRRNSRGYNHFNIRGLSRQAIETYAGFIETLHDRKNELGIPKDDLDRLVKPYVEQVVRWDEDWDAQTFYPTDQPNGFDKRLNEKWLQSYVGEEGLVRQALSGWVASYASSWDSSWHAATILPHVPKPEEFLGTVMARIGDYSVGAFAIEHQSAIEPLLTETSRVLLYQGKAAHEENRRRFKDADKRA